MRPWRLLALLSPAAGFSGGTALRAAPSTSRAMRRLSEPEATVTSYLKITEGESGFAGSLEDTDMFGYSLALLVDLDSDGVPEMAVGAAHDNAGGDDGSDVGAVYILFMKDDGQVKTHVKITSGSGGLAAGTLENNGLFGSGLASLGDLDGDGA